MYDGDHTVEENKQKRGEYAGLLFSVGWSETDTEEDLEAENLRIHGNKTHGYQRGERFRQREQEMPSYGGDHIFGKLQNQCVWSRRNMD